MFIELLIPVQIKNVDNKCYKITKNVILFCKL